MEPARSIGRLGFKRWYERQLIEGHAWLVTCFLCLIAVCVSLEVASFRHSAFEAVFTAAFILVTGVIGWHGLRRYGAIITRAERLAHRATCAACHAYAAFNVIGEVPRMSVRCRRCGHEWTFD